MKLRIGMVGLGTIAQNTYLPILSTLETVDFVGAFSPNQEKTRAICAQYRITPFVSYEQLLSEIEAIFIHSATETHYDLCKQAILAGVAVYVDKPLADTYSRAVEIVEFANQHNVPLMVGFNRRFAPLYQELKTKMETFDYLQVTKHRMGRDSRITAEVLLDDYIHLVDTVYWLSGGDLTVTNNYLKDTSDQGFLYVQTQYESTKQQAIIQTNSHRQNGTDFEKITATKQDIQYEVTDLIEMKTFSNKQLIMEPLNLRATDYMRRGFVGIITEFVDAVVTKRIPLISGKEALAAQKLIANILDK